MELNSIRHTVRVCLITINITCLLLSATTSHPKYITIINIFIMTENQLIDELNMSREEIAEREYERRYCNDEQE